MKLSSYVPEKKKISLAGKKDFFEVRGLSLVDVTTLLRVHQSDMEMIFSLYEKASSEATRGKDSIGDTLILNLLADAPMLAGEIICIASGDPEATSEQARTLPFPTQCEALVAILTLTFEEAGGVKNFLGTLMQMMSGIGVKVPADLTEAVLQRAALLKAS
jgi:hypothetical protein